MQRLANKYTDCIVANSQAVADYAAKSDMLSPEEKARMLAVLERFRQTPITGTQADVDREIAEIRRSRRASSLKRNPR